MVFPYDSLTQNKSVFQCRHIFWSSVFHLFFSTSLSKPTLNATCLFWLCSITSNKLNFRIQKHVGKKTKWWKCIQTRKLSIIPTQHESNITHSWNGYQNTLKSHPHPLVFLFSPFFLVFKWTKTTKHARSPDHVYPTDTDWHKKQFGSEMQKGFTAKIFKSTGQVGLLTVVYLWVWKVGLDHTCGSSSSLALMGYIV